jgi:hypothetical protein
MPRSECARQAELKAASRRNPVKFAENVLGGFLWSKQREVIESVRDNRRTAVRSGHGVGKTYIAAVTLLWFLYSYPNSRVITTATTWPQVQDLLWHEVNALHGAALYPLGGECLQTRLKLPDGRFAVGLSSDPHKKETFQGHHAENLLLIFDEASGIPRPIFEAGEGYMTSAGAKQLLIGNPTQPAGDFFDAFHSGRAAYATHTISVLDSPAFTGEKVPEQVLVRLPSEEFVQDAEDRWGESSPMFQVRVLGQFPSSSDDTVMSLLDVEEAQARTVLPTAPFVVSCDVARFGSDETVIAVRKGNHVRIVDRYVGQDTMHTAGAILKAAQQVPGAKIVVDDDGLGGGVTDRLTEQGFRVTPFRAGASPIERESYPNARSEMWFSLADRLPELDLDPDDQLAADLTSPRYKLDSQGRRVVEKKEETKKRLGRSPDRADAVLMAFWEGQPGPAWSSANHPWR